MVQTRLSLRWVMLSFRLRANSYLQHVHRVRILPEKTTSHTQLQTWRQHSPMSYYQIRDLGDSHVSELTFRRHMVSIFMKNKQAKKPGSACSLFHVCFLLSPLLNPEDRSSMFYESLTTHQTTWFYIVEDWNIKWYTNLSSRAGCTCWKIWRKTVKKCNYKNIRNEGGDATNFILFRNS